MGIDPTEPEKRGKFTRVDPEDCMAIDKLAERMLAGLTFDTVYELAKRFHVHLVTMMFCRDRESYEELRSFYQSTPESEETRAVLTQLDSMVGYSETTDEKMESEGRVKLEEMESEGQVIEVWSDDCPDPIELPDKEFFRNLGLD